MIRLYGLVPYPGRSQRPLRVLLAVSMRDIGLKNGQRFPVLQTEPGSLFRNWRYATAILGIGKLDNRTTVCFDTGCSMTLIDFDLAKGWG